MILSKAVIIAINHIIFSIFVANRKSKKLNHILYAKDRIIRG